MKHLFQYMTNKKKHTPASMDQDWVDLSLNPVYNPEIQPKDTPTEEEQLDAIDGDLIDETDVEDEQSNEK
mgnify:CR=1 FL=1|jgi:hypothetical protein